MTDVRCEKEDCKNNDSEKWTCIAPSIQIGCLGECLTYDVRQPESLEDGRVRIYSWGPVTKSGDRPEVLKDLQSIKLDGMMPSCGQMDKAMVEEHKKVFGYGPPGVIADLKWYKAIGDRFDGAAKLTAKHCRILVMNSEVHWDETPAMNAELWSMLKPYYDAVGVDPVRITDPVMYRHEIPGLYGGASVLTGGGSWQFSGYSPWHPLWHGMDAAIMEALGMPVVYLGLEFGTEQAWGTPACPDNLCISALVSVLRQPKALTVWGMYLGEPKYVQGLDTSDAKKALLLDAWYRLSDTLEKAKGLSELLVGGEPYAPEVGVLLCPSVYGKHRYQQEYALYQAGTAAMLAGLDIAVCRMDGRGHQKCPVYVNPQRNVPGTLAEEDALDRLPKGTVVDLCGNSSLPGGPFAYDPHPELPGTTYSMPTEKYLSVLEAEEALVSIGNVIKQRLRWTNRPEQRTMVLKGRVVTRLFTMPDGRVRLAVVNAHRGLGERGEAEGGLTRLDISLQEHPTIRFPKSWTLAGAVQSRGGNVEVREQSLGEHWMLASFLVQEADYVVLTFELSEGG